MLSINIRHIDTPATLLLPLHFRAVRQLPWHYNFYQSTLLPYTCFYHFHYDDHYDYKIRVILWRCYYVPKRLCYPSTYISIW